MTSKKRLAGIALAATAAAVFATAPLTSMAASHEAGEAQGKCVGGNACKGQSACATASTGCKGQNACKGQGFTKTTEAECEEAGGTWEG